MPVRRLSKVEYVNTVRDLFRGSVDDVTTATADIPSDNRGAAGFAASGTVGGVEMRALSAAAEALAAKAVEHLDALAPCATADAACASQFVSTFARRAFRRPPDATEADALLTIYKTVRAAPLAYDHKNGIRIIVQTVLQSPPFLYHWELGSSAPTIDNGRIRLSGYEIASRLSYALWQSMPDDELLAAAAKDALATGEQIAAQARRLLAQPAAGSAVADFYGQLLGLPRLGAVTKTTPDFTLAVRQAMQAETDAFIKHAVLEDGRLETLLTSPASFVNEPLAKIYGASVTGTTFKQVELPNRSGILTQGSFLAVAATAYGSNPPKRGAMIRKNLMCASLGAPPADADLTPPAFDATAQTRDQFEAKTSGSACKGCHQLLNPIAYGLENFDEIGRWRSMEAGKPINAKGLVSDVDGTDRSFEGPTQLGRILFESEQVRRCTAQRWLTFMLAATIENEDGNVDAAYTPFASTGRFDLRDLLVAITTTPAFRYRVPASEENIR